MKEVLTPPGEIRTTKRSITLLKGQATCYSALLLWLSVAGGWGQNVVPSGAAAPGLFPSMLPGNPGSPAAASQGRRPGAGLRRRTPPPSPLPLVTAPAADPSAGRAAVSASRAEAVQRAAESPLPLLRRPDRNLTPSAEAPPFTLRTTNGDAFAAQISLGVQTALWHNDNLAGVPNRLANGETILEVRPVLRINLGSPPGPRAEKSFSSEAYGQVLYVPTVHTLVDPGTSRTLHRVVAEIGRANPIVLTALRFEHDENVFGSRGENSVEEAYNSTEWSPVVAYSLSAKTSLRARGIYRRITLDNPISNRAESILDGGVDLAATAKTSVGLGSEIGEIRFEAAGFGAQHYEQAYLTGAWTPSVKLTLQTRAGVELRQFEGRPAKPERVSPVVTAVLNYLPDPATRINLGLRVHNEPSISLTGALMQEVRVGMDVRRDFGSKFYARGEAAAIRRDYDTGVEQRETVVRPAIGYHTELGRIFDSLNVELFYQYRRIHSNARDASYDRSIFGIETTVFF